jgi:two-component system phosphate regulon sensor histidine kinase PhoR
VNVAGLVREAAATVRPRAEAKGQTLDVVLPGPARTPDLTVTGDRRRLEQVLLNILHNAIKYTPPGGAIRAGAERQAGQVLVWVQDSGPGIAPAEQTRIFERFYMAPHPGAERGDATGLGLAIAKSLIDLHGGAIGVTSQVGVGSMFYFTLPQDDAATVESSVLSSQFSEYSVQN